MQQPNDGTGGSIMQPQGGTGTTDYTMIVAFFTLQGFFGGGMHTQWPHYLSERFPTEVRATATGFAPLSSGSDLRWPCGAGPVIFRDGVN